MASMFALIIIVVICFVVYAVYKDGQSSGHVGSANLPAKEGSGKPVTIFTKYLPSMIATPFQFLILVISYVSIVIR